MHDPRNVYLRVKHHDLVAKLIPCLNNLHRFVDDTIHYRQATVNTKYRHDLFVKDIKIQSIYFIA